MVECWLSLSSGPPDILRMPINTIPQHQRFLILGQNSTTKDKCTKHKGKTTNTEDGQSVNDTAKGSRCFVRTGGRREGCGADKKATKTEINKAEPDERNKKAINSDEET